MYSMGTGNPREQSLTHSLIQLPPGPDSILSSQNRLFELGESHFKQGDFRGSIPYLKQAKVHFINDMNFQCYFDCYEMLCYALGEQCKGEELEDIKVEFEAVCKRYSIEENPRTLAIMTNYFIGTQDWRKISLVLKRILNLVLNREIESRREGNRLEELMARLDMLYCLSIYISYYYQSGQFKQCREELRSANMLLDDYYQLEDQIREEKSRTDNAQDQKVLQELLWALQKTDPFVKKMDVYIKFTEALVEENFKSREQLLLDTLEKARTLRSDHLIGYIYMYISTNYIELEDMDQAATFLKLAEKYTDFTNFKRLGQQIHLVHEKLEDLRSQNKLKKEYDMIFDRKHRSIVERQKGCISFKNQHILWDIMDLLASRPGTAFSKQKLVERIWKQDYMPLVHDNKIYVTLKRLRELVEQNSRQPVYIRRNKEGYHLNEGARILVK